MSIAAWIILGLAAGLLASRLATELIPVSVHSGHSLGRRKLQVDHDCGLSGRKVTRCWRGKLVG